MGGICIKCRSRGKRSNFSHFTTLRQNFHPFFKFIVKVSSFYTFIHLLFFSCPGSSLPTLAESVGDHLKIEDREHLQESRLWPRLWLWRKDEKKKQENKEKGKRNKKTEGRRDGETEGRRDGMTERKREREKEREREREKESKRERETERQKDGKTERQKDRKKDRLT